MPRILLVARHEFLTNVKRRAFLFAAFGVPIFSLALMVIVFAVAVNNETDTGRVGAVGYVDQSGVLADEVEQPDNFAGYDSEAAAESALKSRAIGAYFVVAEDYLTSGDVRLVSSGSTPAALADEIDAFLVANLGAKLNRPDLVARLQDPMNTSVRTLDNNRTLRESGMAGVFMSPLLLVFVVMFALQLSSGYLMSGVAEEKSNRILEVLITSVRPSDLLLGKIIGLGALGLTQLGLWLAAGALIVRFGHGFEFLSAISLPPDILIVGLVFFVLAYLLFGSIMASIGSIIGSEQESRQYAGLLSFGLAVPFLFIMQFLNDLNGPIPLALSLIPFTAPTTVILRMAYGDVPAWQLLLSIGVMAVTTGLVMIAAGRLFRWSLLLYGKRPGLRALLRVIRGKAAVISSPQEQRS